MPSVAIIGSRGYPSYYGGFETAVRKVAPALADTGWDVTVYARQASQNEAEADPRVDVVVTRGFETRSLSTLSYGLTSVLHATRRRPDVALVMNVANGFWLPLLRAAGIPTLVNVDGIEWERAKWGRLAKGVFRSGARMTARWSDDLVFDSREIARVWKEEFSREGNFIPYGGDLVGEELPPDEGLTRRGYALMVARFVPENSVGEFFAAASEIAREADGVTGGSSGYGGEFDDRARELADGHPRIRWLGHISDDLRLHALLQNAGVYFHGHSAGGTNPALVQAMACGAPIVANDTVYNREVLGDAGILTDVAPRSIAAAATRVLRDPALQHRLSEAARTRAAQEYSWNDVCDAYGSALRRLLPPGTP